MSASNEKWAPFLRVLTFYIPLTLAIGLSLVVVNGMLGMLHTNTTAFRDIIGSPFIWKLCFGLALTITTINLLVEGVKAAFRRRATR